MKHNYTVRQENELMVFTYTKTVTKLSGVEITMSFSTRLNLKDYEDVHKRWGVLRFCYNRVNRSSI